MDDTGPSHERASVTVARWALGGATASLVALASGATALLVVTSTTAVGLPAEQPRPLPGTTAGGLSGSAGVLLLPGGSQPTSGTRARRAGPDSADPLLVLRVAGSGSTATRTGLAARASSDGPDTQSPDTQSPDSQSPDSQSPETQRPEMQRPESQTPETRTPENDDPGATGRETARPQRPGRPGPAPRGTSPAAQEEPDRDAPAPGTGEDSETGSAEEDEKKTGKTSGKDKKDKTDKTEKDEDDRLLGD